MRFSITENPIQPAALREALLNQSAGGFCAFEGWVRNHHEGKEVISLHYEAYMALARKQGEKVIKEALEKFDIIDAKATHRIGNLTPGDLAVWIGVSAAHRTAAFEACQFIINQIKETVPIWKHEFYVDGTDVWVDPTACKCHSPSPML